MILEIPGILPMGGTVARGREALEALFIQQQHLDEKISPTGMAPKFPAESHLGSALQPVHKRYVDFLLELLFISLLYLLALQIGTFSE